MKLMIKPESRISELNKTFNNYFPYLKLEFFNSAHTGTESSPIEEMIKEDLKVQDLCEVHEISFLEFDPLTKISEIESGFRDTIGLNVQVFRKSGNVWLETCGSDNMSLQEASDLGKQKSAPLVKPRTVDFDYD